MLRTVGLQTSTLGTLDATMFDSIRGRCTLSIYLQVPERASRHTRTCHVDREHTLTSEGFWPFAAGFTIIPGHTKGTRNGTSSSQSQDAGVHVPSDKHGANIVFGSACSGIYTTNKIPN
ncbi:hypothetical protein PLICRDRAFT_53814 [Plicaturopsis crispa FD-325 SS-3]|nr:hypothetical protein PLICRDRAFT_53814 [Plicaturopsis crispa FD-325 SS-3]